jgi:hypothetical protein
MTHMVRMILIRVWSLGGADLTEEELSDISFDEVDDPTLFLAQRRDATPEVSPFRPQILSENQPPVGTRSPVRQTGKHSPVKGRSPVRGTKQT